MDKRTLKRLKSEAHHLKAELNIGKEGFSQGFILSLNQAFNTKELLKIKKLDNCPLEKEEIIKRIQEIDNIEFIQNLGNVFTLYQKMQPKTDKK